jgi:hypothetical protein
MDWSFKVLLTAVQFDVFTKLGKRRITGAVTERATGASLTRPYEKLKIRVIRA